MRLWPQIEESGNVSFRIIDRNLAAIDFIFVLFTPIARCKRLKIRTIASRITTAKDILLTTRR